MSEHPEDFCHKCKCPNIVWFAPNELWNKAVREKGEPEILCPVCFVLLVEAMGISPTWEVAPRDYRSAAPQEAFRAGVAACVAAAEVAAIRDGRESAFKVLTAVREVADSAASPAAQEQEVNSGERALLESLMKEHPHVCFVDGIFGGNQPLVGGVRFGVRDVLGRLATHMDIAEICKTWDFTEEQVRDAIAYAQDVFDSVVDRARISVAEEEGEK